MIGWLRSLGRGVGLAAAALLLAVLAFVGWAVLSPSPPHHPPAPAPAPHPPAVVRKAPLAQGCDGAARFAPDAQANTAELDTAGWSPFGRPEHGWRIYAPLVQHELGATCAPETRGFARAVSAWRVRHGLAPSGRLDQAAFRTMATEWLLRRPFVQAMRRGGCPPSPSSDRLATARPEEGYNGKAVVALAPALAAYRAMVAAARADLKDRAADPHLLTIFSAYRGPEEEAARCADGGCNRLTRASCSAHRTGAAFDLYLGSAPGQRPESSDDANRLVQAQSATYGWLVANAGRFGFVPYPFEPWHWEWTGAPAPSGPNA